MSTPEDLRRFIEKHMTYRHLAQAQDIYKLLYQGIFGIGHILNSSAWDRLKEEASVLDLNGWLEEPLLEEASLDGSVVRVNLRPYLRAKYRLEELIDAMRSSEISGKSEDFIKLWDSFVALVRNGKLNFNWNEVHKLDNELNRDAPEPRHHSNQYREAFYPAYRVVLKEKIKIS